MEQKPKQSKAETKSDMESHLIRVKELKTYQPVRFMNDLETHFTARRQKFAAITMVYDTNRQMITLEVPGKDKKIIFPTNVEYIEAE